MANRLKMAMVQSILTLHAQGWSWRRIAQELRVDRGTVSRYARLARETAEADQPNSKWRSAIEPDAPSHGTDLGRMDYPRE